MSYDRACYIMRRKLSGKLEGLGYQLDCIEDWDIVAKIPQKMEREVIDYFRKGFRHQYVANLLPETHKWVAEFMSMYHESYA